MSKLFIYIHEKTEWMEADNRAVLVDALLLPEIRLGIICGLGGKRTIDHVIGLLEGYLARPAEEQRQNSNLVEAALQYMRTVYPSHFPSSLTTRRDAQQRDDIQTTKPAAYKALNGF